MVASVSIPHDHTQSNMCGAKKKRQMCEGRCAYAASHQREREREAAVRERERAYAASRKSHMLYNDSNLEPS